MIWFSSDTHFSHSNILKYCNRPYSNVEEMDDLIFKNFRSCLKKGDTLFFLGDLTFDKMKAVEFFDMLESIGVVCTFIFGNHDHKRVRSVVKKRCFNTSNMLDIEVEGIPMTLSHYAMRVWNKSHYGAWNLFGHSHGTLESIGKQLDVGVDSNGFKPISFEQVKLLLDSKPDNTNLLKGC